MKRIFAGLLLISGVFAQDTFVGDTFDRGSIDYNGRKVKATGIGYIPQNVINAGPVSYTHLTLPTTPYV